MNETGAPQWRDLWVRGGFPRSHLAASNDDSLAWRDSFVSTFLERDVPQLGISIPAAALRRFWTMLAHSHGQTWNASNLGRALSLSDKTVRRYLDLLTGTFMVRQLQPWFHNVGIASESLRTKIIVDIRIQIPYRGVETASGTSGRDASTLGIRGLTLASTELREALAVRGQARTSTETGEAPSWQGATKGG